MGTKPQNFIRVTGPVGSVAAFRAVHFVSRLGTDECAAQAAHIAWSLVLEPGRIPGTPPNAQARTLKVNNTFINQKGTKLIFSFENEPADVLSIVQGLCQANPALEFYGEIQESDGTITYLRMSKGGEYLDVGNPGYDVWCLEQSYLD